MRRRPAAARTLRLKPVISIHDPPSCTLLRISRAHRITQANFVIPALKRPLPSLDPYPFSCPWPRSSSPASAPETPPPLRRYNLPMSAELTSSQKRALEATGCRASHRCPDPRALLHRCVDLQDRAPGGGVSPGAGRKPDDCSPRRPMPGSRSRRAAPAPGSPGVRWARVSSSIWRRATGPSRISIWSAGPSGSDRGLFSTDSTPPSRPTACGSDPMWRPHPAPPWAG